MAVSVDVTRLVAHLESTDPIDGLRAKQALAALLDVVKRVSLADGAKAIRAAFRPLPSTEPDPRTSALLIRLAAVNPKQIHRAMLEERFAELPAEGQDAAMALAAALPGIDAAETVLRWCLDCRERIPPPDLPVREMRKHPEAAAVYFPRLFELAEHPFLCVPTVMLAEWFAADEAFSRSLPPQVDRLIRLFEGHERALREGLAEGDELPWGDEPTLRRIACVGLLMFLERFPAERVRPILARALAGPDPLQQTAALGGWLKFGEPVPAGLIERLAAIPCTRRQIHKTLHARGRGESFPKDWLHPILFAESDLAEWLIASSLARPPAELEFMHPVLLPAERKGEPELVVYLFRFRVDPPHPSAALGWLAGMAGPFPQTALPTDRGTSTGSVFIPWDARTPPQHVQEIFRGLRDADDDLDDEEDDDVDGDDPAGGPA